MGNEGSERMFMGNKSKRGGRGDISKGQEEKL